MRIVSLDIGIKNLAYCMGDYNEETKELFIEEWQIINLIEDELQAQQKCSHISRNRPYKPCKHFAIFKTANNQEFYCKAHKKNYKYVEPIILKLKEINHNYICEEEDCSKKVKYLYSSLDIIKKICSSHKVNLIKFFKKNHSLKKVKTIKCKDYPINKLADKIITIMDSKYQHLLNCDKVLLELQPALAAPKMKSVSNYLSMWFRLRGKHDKVNGSNINEVLYYRATNKLEFNKDNTDDNKNTYKDRKKTGIKNVNDYFDSKNDIINKEKFNNHKKKDDLADALLQILSYIEKRFVIV
jgi:hypothetical protein